MSQLVLEFRGPHSEGLDTFCQCSRIDYRQSVGSVSDMWTLTGMC